MQSGFYLSAYVHVDALANIEKIQVRHDQTIALWFYKADKLELVHYWEIERLTGIRKHSISFFDENDLVKFINELLVEYRITIDDIVEVWGIPLLHKKCFMRGKVKGISCHNSAHIYSVLLKDTSEFICNDYLVLAVDGGPDGLLDEKGDKPFCACYTVKGNIMAWIPIYSPGPLWSIAKKIFGLEEGTLMALMSGCTCRTNVEYKEKILIDNISDVWGATKRLTAIKDEIFNIEFSEENKKRYLYDARFTEWENKVSMFMKILQDICNRVMEINIEKIINELHIDSKETYLSIVGGYALNCPSNSYLVNKYEFKGFYEIPCVSDTGIALGYGLGEFYARNKNIMFKFNNSYFGNSILSSSVYDYKKYILSINKMDKGKFVKDIENGPIIWVDGRSEIGPRALGHRSILADPRKSESKKVLNRIKQRQWWRPVAPIILSDYVKDWFVNGTYSEYMLRTFYINPNKKAYVPAILHLDDSARVQTVSKESNFSLYECMNAFYLATGIPMLCNTSLNDKGEPIIDTIEGIIEFALIKKMPIVYVNSVRIELDLSIDKIGLNTRKVNFDNYTADRENDIICKQLNPYGVSGKGLRLYYDCVAMEKKYSLCDIRTVKIINKLINLYKDM